MRQAASAECQLEIPAGHSEARIHGKYWYLFSLEPLILLGCYSAMKCKNVPAKSELSKLKVCSEYYNNKKNLWNSMESVQVLRLQGLMFLLAYESGTGHLDNFVNAVRDRKDPIANIETGQRTVATCLLGNIATELGRPVSWNPDKQYFVNDPEAEKYFHREYRVGYKL